MAAIAPDPAAITAWRNLGFWTSPAAKTPLTLVFIKNKYNICGGKLIKSIT